MKLKSVSIRGLNNKLDCDFEFHNDINIVTGINGCGKTTFLKILWYAISGNIERLVSEISFKSFNLESSSFSISLINNDSDNYPNIDWEYTKNEIKQRGNSYYDNFEQQDGLSLQSLILEIKESSLFFPTFRRIEGGYSMINPQAPRRIANSSLAPTPASFGLPKPSFGLPTSPSLGLRNANFRSTTSRMLQDESNKNETSIKDEFDELSNSLSMSEHKFICSISTHDLGLLLKSRDDQISQKTNEDFLRLSALLSSQISSDKQDASAILSRIQQENNSVNNKRNELLRPFEILSELVTKVMHYKGIKLDNFILGESDDAIDARLLSYGEQQMLSFLCYNAFYEDSVIFIDEPELSLHPDWQRILFPHLMKQQSSNQFIVATHSPFIYSNYEDKEIILDGEKGE